MKRLGLVVSLLLASVFSFAGKVTVTGTATGYEGKAVSNLAANSGIIYLIKDDAALIGINANTGQEVYRVEVLPQFTENETRTMSYLVAVSDTSIYVYYGDSRELIAFSK